MFHACVQRFNGMNKKILGEKLNRALTGDLQNFEYVFKFVLFSPRSRGNSLWAIVKDCNSLWIIKKIRTSMPLIQKNFALRAIAVRLDSNDIKPQMLKDKNTLMSKMFFSILTTLNEKRWFDMVNIYLKKSYLLCGIEWR